MAHYCKLSVAERKVKRGHRLNGPIRFTDIPEDEGKRNKTCISKVIREGRNKQKVHVKFLFPIENRNRYYWK